MGSNELFRGIQWRYVNNLTGLGATGSNMVLSRAGRVFVIQAVAHTAPGLIRGYDSTNVPQNPVIDIPIPVAGYQFPPVQVTVPLQRGLYFSYSMGTGGISVGIGWDT